MICVLWLSMTRGWEPAELSTSRSPSKPKHSPPPLLSSVSARPSLPLHRERRNIRREFPGLPPSPKRSSICTSSQLAAGAGSSPPFLSPAPPPPSASSGSCSSIQPPSPPFMNEPVLIEPTPPTAFPLLGHSREDIYQASSEMSHECLQYL